MNVSSFLIAVLIIAVGVLAFYVFYAPPKIVAVVERPVVQYDYPVNWVPWSFGRGGWGWPGAFYVNRPMPHFYPRSHPMPSLPPPHPPHLGGGVPRPGAH